VLYREPKLLKLNRKPGKPARHSVSVLYREPKLLKPCATKVKIVAFAARFSALP